MRKPFLLVFWMFLKDRLGNCARVCLEDLRWLSCGCSIQVHNSVVVVDIDDAGLQEDSNSRSFFFAKTPCPRFGIGWAPLYCRATWVTPLGQGQGQRQRQ